MDYARSSLSFKLRKVLRYARLYGVRRTWAKVRGQYHMKKRYVALPPLAHPPPEGGHVGLIGCGNFAFTTIAYYLCKRRGRVVRAAMDTNIHRAASLFEEYSLRYYTDNADRLIADPAINLVYITSNHASHAEYAIAALQAGKSVHIEKPHVVTEEQLIRLCRVITRSPGKVNLGFNRPGSRIGHAIKRCLYAQPGAVMLNWFVAGHEIPPDHWYSRDEEGGRVFGNLCHWTDFIYRLVQPERRYPIAINPTRSVKSDCDIAVTYTFGDGSIAAMTFSAKVDPFEGVRERFTAHKGAALIAMNDFHTLTVELGARKRRTSLLFRDHGHQDNILRSYELVRPRGAPQPGCAVDYVWETGELFLKTRQALEEDERVVVQPFNPGRLESGLPP